MSSSWQRCKDYNVEVSCRSAPLVSEAELYRRRSQKISLAGFARPAMECAARALSESFTMLNLTDESGFILESFGDHRTIDAGRKVHLEDGGCWSEKEMGTNGIGTASATRQPVQIHAAEHFCEDVQTWTCAAAPVLHPLDRELLAVINISGPPKTFGSQNLALVMSIAAHAESLIGQAVKGAHDKLLSFFHDKRRNWANHDMMLIDRRAAIVHASSNALRNLADQQPSGGDLSFLRSVPFQDWEARLAARLANARTVLIDEGDCELGAIIVFSSKQSFAGVKARRTAVSTSSDRAAERSEDVTVPAADGPSCAFVASDARVRTICSQVVSAARMRMPILIGGQTGTGKEELARFIHKASGRTGDFVPVNCTALPEGLIEAELFGYADGAFTGARKGGSAGLAQEAHQGTMFLDEIGDMPLSLQSVLLRFLDDFTVRPIGGKPNKVDLLLVSATNVDLHAAVREKRFRPDLLYRLNTLEVVLPPLRERTDFQEIVWHQLRKISATADITSGAIAALAGQSWPGNVRELRAVLSRLVLMAGDNAIDETMVTSTQPGQPYVSLRKSQRARLRAVYEETGGNISETARRLNVCRNTVYRALNEKGDD
ncbi:sigma-54-dependent Fis family transcriptional regulator [Hyphomicrobium sp.]|uniref:sigma-54-dependent Fis family transcriptional regulator n=1 Tax=Hyphomicrobium sp. TaxID=82 RepID=UPI0025C202C1|nr:sigma-54-dependent Fis family transcriptional regulator [Hyphomicrobium sp.]